MKKSVISYIILGVLVLSAFLIRSNTFWLSHWSGDQENYLALAMKLDNFGLDGYNLRGVDVRKGEFSLYGGKLRLMIGEVLPSEQGDKGDFLRLRELAGIVQYDIPLYYLAPAFPGLLMYSHRIFAPDIAGYRAAAISLGKYVKKTKPSVYFESQFYAVIIPLFFSLLLIVLTFFIGREFFSHRIGLYASFMIAFSAVDIVCSQRIWPADMVSALLALSVFLFVAAIRKKSVPVCFASGIVLGLSVLTRQNVILVFPAFWLYSFLCHRKIADKYVISVFIGALLVSSFWFIKTFTVYGNPVYDTAVNLSDLMEKNKTGFYETMLNRPAIPLLYSIGVAYLSPYFTAFFLSFKKDKRVAFLWLWILSFIVFLWLFRPISREHRYLLPAYPAIAVLSAFALDRFRCFLITRSRLGSLPADFIIAVFLLLAAVWSVNIGISEAITDKSFILIPF